MGLLIGAVIGQAEGVTGQVKDDGQVTIAWDAVNGFGATGPTIELYDDFRNGTDGQIVGLTDPVIGVWDAFGSTQTPVTNEQSLNKGLSMKPVDNIATPGEAQQIQFAFASGVTSWFMTYWSRRTLSWADIATGSHKATWALYESGSNSDNNDYDCCFPTRGGSTDWENSGNSIQRESGWTTVAVNADLWHRFAVWERDINSDEGSPPLAMDYFSQRLTPDVVNERDDDPTKSNDPQGMFTRGDGTICPIGVTVGRVNFPGSGKTFEAWYDCVYIASGGGAAARVEIGNNATYNSCTRLDIATIDSWSNTSITCTLRQQSLPGFPGNYIHIHDSDNAYVGTSRVIT